MLRYIFSLLLLLIIYSCENKDIKHSFEKRNVRNVSFEIPRNFVLKKSNSVDTEVYDIFFHDRKIGAIYFGEYYEPFTEDYLITEEKEVFRKIISKEGKIYYSKNLEQDYKNGVFNNNYYYYDTINRNIAQVMLPKKSKGSIGIYFDSVDVHKNKFAIVSNDISEKNKKLFLEIFRTIKIKSIR